MEYRVLGRSGLKVPVLSFGTGTFGGVGQMFSKWGSTDVAEAKRLIDICLDAEMNFFDTADVYSAGASEEILGEALKGRRNRALISTKATFTTGQGPDDKGSSRFHLIEALDASLRRLQTDHVDIYFMHAFDALTPVDETLRALDDMIRAGKIRYIGCSNFSGWHVMKSIATSERYGLARYVAYQGYYSLIGRDYEWELMPLALAEGIGTMVWSPLGWGRLTGKIRRGQAPSSGRIRRAGLAVVPSWITSICIPSSTRSTPWRSRPARPYRKWRSTGCCSVLPLPTSYIGARNEEQLRGNLAAADWKLDDVQLKSLDAASQRVPSYPYWHQRDFGERNPKPTQW